MNEVFPPLAPVSSLSSLQELTPSRGVEGRASPQGYQFYLPVGSPPRAYFPSSPFVGQNREKPVSPESSLSCRWLKVKLRSTHVAHINHQIWVTISTSSLLFSAISSSPRCRTWSTTSTTFMSSPKRILGIVASGRGVHGMGGALTPGKSKSELSVCR